MRVLVTEGQRVRTRLPRRHFVEGGHGTHIDIGDLAIAQTGVPTGVVRGQGDLPGPRHHRVVGADAPERGPAATAG